jgi:hypothetical protein
MMKKITFLLLMLMTSFGFSQSPAVGATAPIEAAADVISIFSDTYTDVPVNTFLTTWSQVGAYTQPLIAGNPTLSYVNLNFVGIETVGANSVDASQMEYFHIDVWSANATEFRVKLVDLGSGAVEGELPFNIATNQWVSLKIPIADFADASKVTDPSQLLTVRTSIQQYILSGNPAGQLDVFVDNIYFSKDPDVDGPINDVTGDIYINDNTFAAGDFTTAAGQDIATNDGSAAEPFATLDYALARSTQSIGDVIYIDAGTYSWDTAHELTASGTLVNPITIQGKENETNITSTVNTTTSAGLHFTTGNHWVLKDLNWTATAARAVWVAGVDGIILDNCTINMTSVSNQLQSIIIGTAGGELTIKNSTLTRSNFAFHMVATVAGTALIMQDNTVSFANYGGGGNSSGVDIDSNPNTLIIIERNKFINGGYGIGTDGGVTGDVNPNSVIRNNFFNGIWGIINTRITGLKVYNNSFYTALECIGGFGTALLNGWDIQNNIFHVWGTNRASIRYTSTTSHPLKMDYNQYFTPNTGAGEQATGTYLSFTQWQNAAGGPWEANGQEGNPQFVNPANQANAATSDLHLLPSSPAIGAGVDVGITDDIDGDARPLSGTFDMGADEFAPILNDATLSDLQVDGTTVEGFSPSTYDYAVLVPFGSEPEITAIASNSNASISITQTPAIPVEGTVLVTAEDGVTTQLYTVSFEVLQSYIIQDFEDSGTFTALTGDNGTVANIVIPPAGSDNGNNCLQLESRSSLEIGESLPPGQSIQSFQAGYFTQVVNFVHFTESNTIEVDVFSGQTFNLLLKLEVGGSDTQVSQPYTTPNTWQTLTYTFVGAHPVDPDGVYERIVFFPNSNSSNNGFVGPDDFTIYIDNIKASSTRDYYIHQSNTWTPEVTPVGNSKTTDNILVIDGEPDLNGLVKGGFLQVLSGASLNFGPFGVLDLAGDIINNGDIVFKSDTNGSGQLAEFNRSITGSGEITSERFIPAGEGPDNGNRAFRYLSSSITTTESIFENWQEGGDYTISNLGTHITGEQGTVGSYDPTTGLDYTASGNPSMFGFDNSVADQVNQNAWLAVLNTKDTDLEAGKPYAIMIRGDRTTNLTTNTPTTSNTVLRAKGNLKTGPVTETFTQPDNFVLVGNPYQSVVDLKEIDYTGVFDDEFYVWDPRLGDNDNGAYVTVTTSSGEPNPSTSEANEFLQPGQAVFMLTEPTGLHSITFRESDKATGVPQTEVFSTTNIPYLNMRLYTTARFNAGGKEHDAMGLRFHDENTIHQFRNARKLGNSAETMAFLVGDDFASIQHAVLEADENQFPIYLGSYQHQEYTFWFQLENLPEGVTAYLKDDYTEELTELQQGVNSIAFTVDAAIQGSISTNRFSIAFDVESLSNEDFEEPAFEFYPNPTDAILSINLGSYQATNTKVKIYDVTGRLLMQTNFTTNESIIQIDMSQLNTGLYFVEVAEGDKKFTSKVLKR